MKDELRVGFQRRPAICGYSFFACSLPPSSLSIDRLWVYPHPQRVERSLPVQLASGRVPARRAREEGRPVPDVPAPATAGFRSRFLYGCLLLPPVRGVPAILMLPVGRHLVDRFCNGRRARGPP